MSRAVPVWVTLAVLTVGWTASATHDDGCVPGQADPATVHVITTPDGRTFYVEERGGGLDVGVLVPGSGFLFGDETWLYEETNGLGGLQRGGMAPIEYCLPPPPAPCVLHGADPIPAGGDEHCGHGPDAYIV